MDEASIAGVVAITMALMEGFFGLTKFIINKYTDNDIAKGSSCNKQYIDLANKLDNMQNNLVDITRDSKKMVEMHSMYDGDGTPIWYVPRSWAETQKEIAERLQAITEVNMKMLGIIERLENRLDRGR